MLLLFYFSSSYRSCQIKHNIRNISHISVLPMRCILFTSLYLLWEQICVTHEFSMRKNMRCAVYHQESLQFIYLTLLNFEKKKLNRRKERKYFSRLCNKVFFLFFSKKIWLFRRILELENIASLQKLILTFRCCNYWTKNAILGLG